MKVLGAITPADSNAGLVPSRKSIPLVLKKRKIEALGCPVANPPAKKKCTGLELEAKLIKDLGNMQAEIHKRLKKWSRSSIEHEEKSALLERMKKKLERSEENSRIDDLTMMEHRAILDDLLQEQKGLEDKRERRHNEFMQKVDEIEAEIAALKRKLPKDEPIRKVKAPRPQPPPMVYKEDSIPKPLRPCAGMIKKLEKLENIAVFLNDVPIDRYPDYDKYIKKRMCLITVKNNLYQGKYTNINQFARDVRIIWANARAYNPKNNPVHEWAILYSEIFEKMFRIATSTVTKKKKKVIQRPVLTPAEIASLQRKMTDLHPISMGYIIDFLQREMPEKYGSNNDQITFDFTSMPSAVLLKLKEIVQKESEMKPRNRAQKRQRIKRQIEHLKSDFKEPSKFTRLPPPPTILKYHGYR